MRNRTIFALLASSLLLGLSPLAADSVIHRGIDVFTTAGDGRTFYDFSHTPIPAGFFCERSKAFTGRVAFKGLPLVTKTPGALRGADTVVERLDDAAFNDEGVAATRLQFRALSLVSNAPVKTACGAYHVYVSLVGKQRVTTMKILRTQEGGGHFIAPLAADVRMTFIPVKPVQGRPTKKLALEAGFTFPAQSLPWSFRVEGQARKIGAAVIDTDGNLSPDTLIPGSSNFAAGQSPEHIQANLGWEECPSCAIWTCHTAEGHEHCYSYVPPHCLEVPIC